MIKYKRYGCFFFNQNSNKLQGFYFRTKHTKEKFTKTFFTFTLKKDGLHEARIVKVVDHD